MNTSTATALDCSSTPRVWVGCLASYNAGDLHGLWVDATDVDELQEGIDEVLASSPAPGAEEFHICDHENFGGLEIHRYDSVEHVCELGALVEEHGEMVAALVSHFGAEHLDEVRACLRDRFIGTYPSEGDFAFEQKEDEVPADLLSYVDFEAMERDMEINGDIMRVEVGGEIHVFSNR